MNKANRFNFGWKWWLGLLAVLVVLRMVGMGVQSAAVEEVAPNPFAKYVNQPACPAEHSELNGGCVAHIAARGFVRGCPGGYVDHPVDPNLCALPFVAERMIRR